MAQRRRYDWFLAAISTQGTPYKRYFMEDELEEFLLALKRLAPSITGYGLCRVLTHTTTGKEQRHYAYVGSDGRVAKIFDNGHLVPLRFEKIRFIQYMEQPEKANASDCKG